MRIAIVNSPNIHIKELERFLPEDTAEISGEGEGEASRLAGEYALAKGIKFTECLPEYEKYGRDAPFKRYEAMIEKADLVLVFWDGLSKGIQLVLGECAKRGIAVRMFLSVDEGEFLELEPKHAQVFGLLAQTAKKKGKSIAKMSAGEMSPRELLRLIRAVIRARGISRPDPEERR